MQETIDLIQKLNDKFTDFLTKFADAEEKAKTCLKAIEIARGHINGDKGAILPLVNQIQKTYHSKELSKDSNIAITKAGYSYTGKGN